MANIVATCLLDGSALIEHSDLDDCDGYVMWWTWFECQAHGHYYHAENCEGTYLPTDEEFDERYPKSVIRTPLTPEDRNLIGLLAGVRFAPATWDKRFAHNLMDQAKSERAALTDRQREWLRKCVYKYRRQIASR